jgi:hypothetical protein
MCRKFTGCILPQNLSIPTGYISPPLPSNKTYKSYSATASAYRSFCSNCGSSLAFNYNDSPEVTELYIGSIDEDVLCGKKVGESEDRKCTKRDGSGLGYDLGKVQNHIWLENAIEGVTNKLEGGLYVRDRQERYKMN